jgi:hypothetical protein
MSLTTASSVSGNLLERLQWPREEPSPAAARFLLSISFSKEDQERMQELAEKAQEGSLSPAERQESIQYDLFGHFLAKLHSRARRALRVND